MHNLQGKGNREGGKLGVWVLPREQRTVMKENVPSCSEVSFFFLTLGRFLQLEELGRKIVHQKPSNNRSRDVQQTMERLAKEKKQLEEMWEKRWKKLQDGLELQKFNREGDRINAALSGHEAFLRGDDLGVWTAAHLVSSCFFSPSRV